MILYWNNSWNQVEHNWWNVLKNICTFYKHFLVRAILLNRYPLSNVHDKPTLLLKLFSNRITFHLWWAPPKMDVGFQTVISETCSWYRGIYFLTDKATFEVKEDSLWRMNQNYCLTSIGECNQSRLTCYAHTFSHICKFFLASNHRLFLLCGFDSDKWQSWESVSI